MKSQPADRHIRNIEATDYESAQWRICRLHHTLGYVAAILDINGAGQLARHVEGVHDQKGVLQVRWLKAPNDIERNAFKIAWASQVGDGSDLVEHFIGEVQIT